MCLFLLTGNINNVPVQETLFFRLDAIVGKRQIEDNFDLFGNITFTDEEIEFCEDNVECLVDLAVTGNRGIAGNALDEQKTTNATREMLSM